MQLLKLCISQCRIYGVAGAGNEGAFASPYFRASCIGETRLVVDPGVRGRRGTHTTQYAAGDAAPPEAQKFTYFPTLKKEDNEITQ